MKQPEQITEQMSDLLHVRLNFSDFPNRNEDIVVTRREAMNRFAQLANWLLHPTFHSISLDLGDVKLEISKEAT